MRGLVFCETHRRRYHGQPVHKDSWRYVCTGAHVPGSSKCATPILPGPGLENRIKEICRDVLSKPELIEAELTKRSGQVAETTQTIEKKLIGLDKKEKAALATESNIIKLQAKGDASPEAYKMALAEMKAEKVWIKEERDRLLDQLNMVKQRQGAIITLAEAREWLCALVERGTTKDWRDVLSALDVRVNIITEGTASLSLAIPVEATIESGSSWDV